MGVHTRGWKLDGVARAVSGAIGVVGNDPNPPLPKPLVTAAEASPTTHSRIHDVRKLGTEHKAEACS